MCNLYSMTSNQRALVELMRVGQDRTGNLPSLPAIYPDSMAPVVRQTKDGERDLAMLRWGMPGAPQYGGRPVTNIRNTASPHWRRWLGPAHRCLVPVTSFAEWEDTKPKKTPVWFALSKERPPFAFAGIWTSWTGTRGPNSNPVEGEHELFGFLTCDPNKVVGPIHPKAMPVLLTKPEEMETWLEAPWETAKALQRPLPDAEMVIVSKGNRTDPG
ncbi:SOS response-associated peptidase [Sabulicella glaciei]|uniref:Abasic site processing protein n=1 Tax=Sabulicella glaciei TaxID=2984948 RepID=A0ABT3P2K2_9PROT|nr:SOS response-associated peptidase [Roseococcus sp. MDT2-1-1]